MLIEEVYLKSLGASIQVLIFTETSEQWREWRAFNQVLGSNDDVALKLYTALLGEKRKLLTRDLGQMIGKSRYTVNRHMKNLMTIGLVGCDFSRRGLVELQSWYPKQHVLGMMRLVPAEYFNGKFPKKMLKKDK